MKENQLRPNELNWILQIQALYVLLSQTLLYLEGFFMHPSHWKTSNYEEIQVCFKKKIK